MADIKFSDMTPWTGAVTGNVAFPAVFANENYLINLSQITTSTFGFGSMAMQNSDAVSITGGSVAVTTLSGAITIANGGTGLEDTPTNGQLLIGNGTGYSLSTLTAGSGVTIANTAGHITISASNTGTVTSVGMSGGTTGLSFSGANPITSSGTFTLQGTLGIANGGTGATTATAARTALSAAKSGANSDITSLTGLTTPLSVIQGGTGNNDSLSGYIFGNGTLPFTAVLTIPASDISGTLPVAHGGTGSTTSAGALVNLLPSYTGNAGKVLSLNSGATGVEWKAITGTGTVTSVDLTAGTGISVAGGPITTVGSITVTNTAPDQIVSLTGAGTTVITGTYPSFTITSEDDFTGTVTSVDVSGGTTGLTFTGGPITNTGTITMGGTLGVANGGTGAITLTGYVKGNGTSAMTASATIPASDISSGAALTRVDDTNVTLTLGGSPASALLAATSLTLGWSGQLSVARGGTGASTASRARANLSAAILGANNDITSMSALTGAISSPTYIQYGSGSGTALAAGRMWYDNTTGSMNVGMGGGNITQQIGEELFIYGKASAAIADSPLQIVRHTGTVGSSGVITFGPTVSGITDGNLIIGVATESIALNAFGRITTFGVIHGVTTNGTAYGEVWADGDMIWYNPVTGNPTNVKPVAPNLKVSVGIIINAGSGGSGSFQVEINHGSVLGGTDSNVQLTSPADGQLLQYYGAGGYWRNLSATSVAVTSFSGGTTGLTPSSATQGAITLGGTLAIANGGTNSTATPTAGGVGYGTGTAHAFTSAGTAGQVLVSNGSSAPTFGGINGGTF